MPPRGQGPSYIGWWGAHLKTHPSQQKNRHPIFAFQPTLRYPHLSTPSCGIIIIMSNLPTPRKARFPTEDEMARICLYIQDGLSVRESCILAGYDHDEFKEAMSQYRSVRNMVEKKEIEFKYERLKRLKNDSKSANQVWLLENLRPTEFGKQKGEFSSADPAVTIATFIKEIQSNNNSAKLVNYEHKNAVQNEEGVYTVENVLQ